MGTKLKQGQKYKPGHTKNKILLTLCAYPEGIQEPELRDTIKSQLGISDPKGIKDHLDKLKEEGYISKIEQNGKANIWLLKPENFSSLADKFLGTRDEHIFHASAYLQKMITPTLLREIEKHWDMNKPYPSKTNVEKELKEWEIISQKLPDLKMPHWNYGNPDFFTEEDILEILRLSSTALKKALAGPPIQGMARSQFEGILLSSLILDSSIKYYPGYQFWTELGITIYKLGEKESFSKRCNVNTIHDKKILVIPPPYV